MSSNLTRVEPLRVDHAPLMRKKCHNLPSVFSLDNLLKHAQRQQALPTEHVPEICVLDPDGDIVRYLLQRGEAGGSVASLASISMIARQWQSRIRQETCARKEGSL